MAASIAIGSMEIAFDLRFQALAGSKSLPFHCYCGFVFRQAAEVGAQTETAHFADWEIHGRGIASKLMARMGHTKGQGLGKRGAMVSIAHQGFCTASAVFIPLPIAASVVEVGDACVMAVQLVWGHGDMFQCRLPRNALDIGGILHALGC
jgi:hypothetical protein